MPFTVNQNRLIKLYRTNATVEDNDNSWRHCFSKIISDVDDDKGGGTYKIVNINEKQALESFNVDENIDLLMEELPEFNSQNNYDTPIYNFLSKFEALGGIVEGVAGAVNIVKHAIGEPDPEGENTTTTSSFSPWAKNIPAWDGAPNFNFQLTFNFAMGQYGLWNARQEVFNPIINLLAPTLPQHLNGYSMSGPVPNTTGLLVNLINKGIDIGKLGVSAYKSGDASKLKDNKYVDMVYNSWNDLSASVSQAEGVMGKVTTALTKGAETLGTFLEALTLMSYEDYTFTLKLGNIMNIQKVMIKDSTWSFGKEVDQYGWPTSGQVKLKFETAIPLSLTSSGEHNMSVRFGA